MQLLDVAARDLREVRAQLKAWRVMRDGLFRRDERPVWLPHWRQEHRQPFQDGVCVAELFIAVRRKLVEREIAYRALWAGQADPPGRGPPTDRPHGPFAGSGGKPKLKRELRRAVRIASLIAGDSEYLNTVLARVLTQPSGELARASRRDHACRLPRAGPDPPAPLAAAHGLLAGRVQRGVPVRGARDGRARTGRARPRGLGHRQPAARHRQPGLRA